jgi:flagellar basal body rod protein FlgC
LQWLQDPNQSNVDNLNSVIHEAGGHFRRKEEFLKAKLDELKTNSKIKNIGNLCRGISDFKKVYQSRTNAVKLTDCYTILPRSRNHFSLLLNVRGD